MKKKTTTVRAKRRRIDPSIPAELISDAAKMYIEQQNERERQRANVFHKAWDTCTTEEQRVTLAVAYLGGGSK